MAHAAKRRNPFHILERPFSRFSQEKGRSFFIFSYLLKFDFYIVVEIYQNMYYAWKIRISPSIGGEYAVVVDAIGKTVFLTREEAEQALRERELK